MSVEEAFSEIRTHLTGLEDLITAKANEVAKLDEKLAIKVKEYNASEEDLADHKVKIDEEKAKLDEEIKPVRSEVQRLKGELQTLYANKSELLVENRRLAEQNTKFVQYEIEARKVLKATETSLIEREKAVQQRESLKPINRSILPPEGE